MNERSGLEAVQGALEDMWRIKAIWYNNRRMPVILIRPSSCQYVVSNLYGGCTIINMSTVERDSRYRTERNN